ncbi:MAG: hypothetical protein EA365_03850 [Gloeocapsa sp. DLM2.Bin57]|nr:MAG: hypothetical protein EA365_03850 [Gloeocapsa sp. DLM2.Bin57]
MITTDYITQSLDTDIDAEFRQFQLWREMSSTQKFNLLKRLYQKASNLILLGINHQYSHLSKTEFRSLYIKKRWGNFADKIAQVINFQGDLMLEDPLWLIQQLSVIFERLNIPYYVSGSVASSLQGEVRFTQSLDLAIDIQPEQGVLLIEALSPDFYISEVAVNEAIQGITTSFKMIHLQTIEKAAIFISGKDEFSVSKMNRRQLYQVEKSQSSFYVCSPEDTILQKLLWLKMGQDQSEKQWRDVLGVLKLQRESLDFAYLGLWGERLGVKERLQQGIIQSGLSSHLLP